MKNSLMMKVTHLIYIFIIASFLSCGGKKEGTEKVAPPADIVTPEQMKAVLVDVFLAEGAVGTSELKNRNAKYMSLHYYKYVLKRHKMTSAQFTANFTYYASDIDQMEKIMTEVITELSEKQDVIKDE
jgi:hypothetical protein